MDHSKERFLVTGASGFVGGCLVRRLVELGANVHAMIHSGSDLWRLKDIRSRMTLHEGDIIDANFTVSVVDQAKPTVVYHLAAHGAYSVQNNARRILMTNVQGTYNLLEALVVPNFS